MTVLFADISGYQTGADWAATRLPLVCIKATEGTAFHDPLFASHVAGARGAGIPYGAYHFLDHGNGAGQALNFLGALGDLTQYWGFQLDIEGAGLVAQDVTDFMAVWRQHTSRPIFQYGPKAVLQRCSGPQYGLLWLADYPGGGYPGDNFATWNLAVEVGWTPTLWQYGPTTDPAFPHPIDGDAFRGSLADLLTLGGSDVPLDPSIYTAFVADFTPGATVYADAARKTPLFANWQGGKTIGIVGEDTVNAAGFSAPNVCINVQGAGGARVLAYVGADHITPGTLQPRTGVFSSAAYQGWETLVAAAAAESGAVAEAVAAQKATDADAIAAAVDALNVLTAKVNAAKAALG